MNLGLHQQRVLGYQLFPCQAGGQHPMRDLEKVVAVHLVFQVIEEGNLVVGE